MMQMIIMIIWLKQFWALKKQKHTIHCPTGCARCDSYKVQIAAFDRLPMCMTAFASLIEWPQCAVNWCKYSKTLTLMYFTCSCMLIWPILIDGMHLEPWPLTATRAQKLINLRTSTMGHGADAGKCCLGRWTKFSHLAQNFGSSARFCSASAIFRAKWVVK